MSTANPAMLTSVKAALNIYDTPDPSRVLIVDTSHWTGIVDWQKAKAAGLVGAIIKFIDGTSITKYAVENYKGAKDAGLLVGGYHWLYRSADISAGRQARAYLDFLKDHPCDIRPAIDFEWTKVNGVDANPNSTDLYGFVVPFEDGYGKKPMIYTAPGYWNQYGSKAISWADYPLWKAQYRVKSPDAIMPWGDSFKFWQFTANGKGSDYGFPVTGEKEADLNYWIGTLVELYAWCASTPVPPIPPTASFNGATMTLNIGPDGTPSIQGWSKL